MKSSLFSILIFLFSITFVTAQATSDFNQKNAKGQKVGKWKGYYKDGSVRYVGQFKNDKPFGIFYNYYGDGKVQAKKEYRSSNNVFVTLFYSTGEFLARGKYIDKLKDSTWITYGAKNRVVEKGDYSAGKKIGIWRTFLETGEISAEMNYVNDLKNGPYRIFYQDGSVKDSSNFKLGKLNGLSTLYDSGGKKILKGLYVNGKKDKRWIYYGEQQKVDKILIYENGKLINPEELKKLEEDLDQFSGNRKDVLEFEDLRGTINYE